MKIAQQRNHIKIDYLCDIHKLNKIDSTFATFDVRDKRLMPTENFGNLGLR
ncbi:hypothetical protein X727_12495 [Mesorhizobium sp. L103C119B0]|nr:hypothetical protein X727_12495 [Mesorhizobium sp. L103C119B0]